MASTCDTCGIEFHSTRTDARYCSGRCRTGAYRKRQDPDRPAPKRAPLPDQMRRRTSALVNIVFKIDDLTHDDRFDRYRKSNDSQVARRQLENLHRQLGETLSRF